MAKRKRAAQERAARSDKFARRMKARLLTELLLTPADGLDDFQRSLKGREDESDLQPLQEMQSILDALGNALQQGDEHDWRRVHEAWEALHLARPATGQSTTPASPPRPVEPGSLPRDELPKPRLADPAPAAQLRSQSSLPAPKAPPRPARLASTPPAFIVPPSEPAAPAPSAAPSKPAAPGPASAPGEHTSQHALPNPQPPLPFRGGDRSKDEPPGRLVPPDPWAPLPPVGAAAETTAAEKAGPWPPRARRPTGHEDDEHTGETDLIDPEAMPQGSGPALPFGSPSESPHPGAPQQPSDAAPRPQPGRSRKPTVELPEGFGHPLADALEAAGMSESPYEDEDPPTLAKRSEAARTARRWLAAIDDAPPLDEHERTPHWDELPWASELDSIPAPDAEDPWDERHAAQRAAKDPDALADDTGPLPALAELPKPSAAQEHANGADDLPRAYPLDDFSDAAGTIHGQPPGFLARLHSITMEQYASMQAELAVFPERVDEVRRTLGLNGAAQQLALDDLWARRFAQNPDVRSLFDLLFTRYRAWLQHQGQG